MEKETYHIVTERTLGNTESDNNTEIEEIAIGTSNTSLKEKCKCTKQCFFETINTIVNYHFK